MDLKPGDKVRFLNEKGGGIVTGIINSTMAKVAIEEGFEVPVLIKDLLLIEPRGAADRFFDKPVNVTIPANTPVHGKVGTSAEPVPEPSSPAEADRISTLFRQAGIHAAEGIYLAYAPHDQKWTLSGNLDMYLVNNTGYDALFSLSLMEEEKGYAGVDYDVIPPFSKMLIESINREDIESWADGIVQVLFHKSEAGPVLSPLHAAFKIKPVRFYKESSYADFPLIGLKSVMVNLGDLAGQISISSSETFAKSGIDPAAKEKLAAISPPAIIDIHKTALFEAEVDLHISALVKDYSNMPGNEILKYQVGYFSRMLESAIANNYNKVVFIHGIGNGILKTILLDRLAEYEHVRVRNASFNTYGNGAIEVTIAQNA